MFLLRRIFVLLIVFTLTLGPQSASAQGRLEDAFAELYATCLFDIQTVENNPFSQAASLAEETLAPGLSGFIESNLAAIPLTPPSLDAEYTDGKVINVVTGFTPVYTESSATVGEGLFLVGSNLSHSNLSQIRGKELDDLQFTFEQNGGGDRVSVTMPFDLRATVFTLHGAYGVTNRFDVGIALPFVRLSIENVSPTFRVEGNNTGCRYSQELGQEVMWTCNGMGPRETPSSVRLYSFVGDQSETEFFLGTVALRAKYRFPVSVDAGRLAAVLDVRIPTRKESNIVGRGNFGTHLTFVGEYNQLGTFEPYINVGGEFWNGRSSNSFNAAFGFNQQFASNFFFTVDLLGEVALEPDSFLGPIENPSAEDASTESVLTRSSIPAVKREHTLDAGVGLQWTLSPSVHAYGSALFALLDRGLQSTVAPTVGIAAHF